MRIKAIATIAILLLSSRLLAESQEAVYYEAMKAEEAGEISKSIELFEKAAEIDGPYTDEIRDILKEYYQALGMDESPFSFRLRGDVSVHGMHYEESGGYEDVKDNGAETYFGLSLFANYTAGSLIHSFILNFSGNAFLGDTISSLDSAKWALAPGVEYDLVGESFLVCAGIDFKFNEKEWYPFMYGWLEKSFFRFDKNKFGAALSISEEWERQFAASLFASWRRFSPRGFNVALFVGARFIAEDVFDYDAWVQAIQNSGYGKPPDYPDFPRDSSFYDDPYRFGNPDFSGDPNGFDGQRDFGEQGDFDDRKAPPPEDSTWNTVDYPEYNVKWIGPYLRGRISYKFKYNITAEIAANIFYGIILDGPNSSYEEMSKLTGLWGPTLYWSPNIMTFYVGAENTFRHYFDIPESYQEIQPESTSLWELKLGMKLDW